MTRVLTGAAADAALEEAQRTGYRYPPEFRGFAAVMALTTRTAAPERAE